MMFFAVSTGILLLAAATIAYSVYRFAQKRDDDEEDDHSVNSELRCITRIETQHTKGFWI